MRNSNKIKDNKEWNELLVKYGNETEGKDRMVIFKKLAGIIDKSKPRKPTAKSLFTPLHDYLNELKDEELRIILKNLEFDEIIINNKSLKSAWNEELKTFVQDAIGKFKYFTLYLEPLATNMDQVFSTKRNGLANRIVFQNFYTFIRNKKALDDLKIVIEDFRNERDIAFTAFSDCLLQTGIDEYNKYIGQLVQKLKEYSDSHPISSMWHKRFKQLNKQILSPRIAPSWLPASFTNDEIMVVAIRAFLNNMNPLLPALSEIVNQIETYDDHIFIYRKSLRSLAVQMAGLYTYLDDAFDIPRNYSKSDSLSLQWMSSDIKEEFINFFKSNISAILLSIQDAYAEAEEFLCLKRAESNDYRRNNQASVCLNRLMYAFKQLYNQLRPLTGTGDEEERNEDFYGDFIPIVDTLQPINELFDCVRNWLTKAAFTNDSYPVYLGKATILDNWSNNTVYLKKDGKYYFLLLNGIDNLELQNGHSMDTIMYRFYTQPANRIDANLTRQFLFSKKANLSKGREEPIMAKFVREHLEELFDDWTRVKNETYKISENKEDLVHAINYFQKCLKIHPDYNYYNFDFRPATEYDDYASFVESLKGKLFRIEEKTICWNSILQLVEDGKVYLFQLYNKDYANNRPSGSTPNLHTLYWEAVFSQQNRISYDFKLEEPKLFFREIADVIQRTGEFYSVPLRYQKPKMHLHIPILMNANAQNLEDLNQLVFKLVQTGIFTHIIGIDRGERNLLYYSILDMNGNLVNQGSLNVINGIDYHEKLMEKELEIDDEQKNWKARSVIRKLKEGYLSHAIHQLTNMIIQYNALVVIEDLDENFKRGRQKIDMQIYQLFEKMLIDKLSFLVYKKLRDNNQTGSIFRALQLTEPGRTLSQTDIKQNGILFLVPPEYTSAIDPVTGFCNLFDRNHIKDIRKLLPNFERISYNVEKDWFEFEWDYQAVVQHTRMEKCTHPQHWVACSFGERIEWTGCKRYRNLKCEYIDITAAFKALFEKYQIQYNTGMNLKDALSSINKKEDLNELKRLFFLTVQLRNKADKNTDYILSPVQDTNGSFFDSRNVTSESLSILPDNGDANGAYNIARKGLFSIYKLKKGSKEALSLEEWIQRAKAETCQIQNLS